MQTQQIEYAYFNWKRDVAGIDAPIRAAEKLKAARRRRAAEAVGREANARAAIARDLFQDPEFRRSQGWAERR